LSEEGLRKEAVRRRQAGEGAEEVAAALGRTSRWVRKWVARAEAETDNEAWAQGRSRAPHHSPTRLPDELRRSIVDARSRLTANPRAQYGPLAIAWELRRMVADHPWCKRATDVGSFRSVQTHEGEPTSVTPRVSPTARLRAQIDELFASDQDLASVLEDVGRLTVRLLMQQAIEAEVEVFLGRHRYEPRTEEHPAGYRNGWQPPASVKTTMGPVELQRPKLRETDERFCSQLFGLGVTRTHALDALVISAWVRGLSDRDVEAALREVLGDEAALSKSTVSRICQQVKEDFAAFATSELGRLRLDYLFLDGTNFRFHEHSPAEPVLVAWGIDTDGKPHLVGLAAAASESTEAWRAFLEDLVQRGLRDPLLVVSDGAPGLIAAVEQVFPGSLRQRCVIHRLRNAVAKVSAADQDSFKSDWWEIFDGIEEPPGDKAVAEARRRMDGFKAQWGRAYPSAVACLVEDFESLTVHLRFPAEHWRRCRHTNLIERTFGETRRRTKVMGRLPGERTCVSLVFAVLDRQSRGWRGMTMTPRALRRLQDLRRQLFEPPTTIAADDDVTTAA